MWAVLEGGPLDGEVLEVDITARAIQVTTKREGVACYRRIGWGRDPASHRIARFKFTKTLVV